ncbi:MULTISPECIES: mechanosensitive ion channel family protein [unclassified Zunongwangia]|uniref:mechanosensitive ion channel family protein n=1 Tax=unclassified Zunongwangia TaxID=2632541 RepID=UPI0022DD0C0B|nr:MULTISPECIES: mechanosensitive ion channel domain-containing protein [unclassified Zunongwangia]WBL21429.1 mechanosensitive ion channel [Zunongwangia sp. HRR-M8]WBL26623.1 mechanosensitive ion channel [Zunongwangia sp. HGR-M22]
MQNNDTANQISEVLEQDIWGNIKNFLNFPILQKPFELTVGTVILVIFVFVLTSVLLRVIRNFIAGKLLDEDKLKFISVFKFVKYVVYLIVILITLSSTGIDISILLTASAALFVGVGLALQELFQDIIGGIFIILDKSLLVGDIIEVDNKVARVFEIKLRTTRALTRDDKVMIIPNHKFISDTVYNYTQNHRTTRENVKVGVAYGSDTKKVQQLLLDCVAKQKGILKTPKPFVLFEDFGDSALLFGLYFYLSDSFTDPKVKSELRFKIDDSFRQNGITIPFPQRDVHMFYPNNTEKE